MPKLAQQTYEIVSIDAIRPYPRNPNEGDRDMVLESIEANDFYGACLVQKSTGYIIAGKTRHASAVDAGLTTIPVI